jgi:hypothetical protein
MVNGGLRASGGLSAFKPPVYRARLCRTVGKIWRRILINALLAFVAANIAGR